MFEHIFCIYDVFENQWKLVMEYFISKEMSREFQWFYGENLAILHSDKIKASC